MNTTAPDFISAVRSQIIAERQQRIRDVLNMDPATVRGPRMRMAIEWFATMSPDQREMFLSMIREAAVDTMSVMLGIIDGVGYMPPFSNGFVLSTGDGIKLDGNLCDLFLEAEECDRHG